MALIHTRLKADSATLVVQPVVKKAQGRLQEVQPADPRFRTTALRQGGRQLPKAAPDRSGRIADHRHVFGAQRFKARLPQAGQGVAVQQIRDRLLSGVFDPIGLRFLWQEEKNLVPDAPSSLERIPGPGEPGFRFIEQPNLFPGSVILERPARQKRH